LRVLQDRTFERLGDTRTRSADVRVIAASNRDLSGEVAAGRFREDLFYRIHVVTLALPPLRERPGDIPLLAEHFLARFSAEYGRETKTLDPASLALLTEYPWPGNVRELEHAIERAVLLCRGTEVGPDDVAPGLSAFRAAQAPLRVPPPAVEVWPAAQPKAETLPLREALEIPEREIIRRALERNGGNRKATAEMLNVNRTTLFNKMRKYRLMDFPIGPD
jgi:DNA-binding NtrC family response regulator